MMRNFYLSIVLVVISNVNVFPQFLGGDAEGFAYNTLIQTACPSLTSYNFYYGGNADGFAYDSILQTVCPSLTSPPIYYGGNADGFAYNNLTQTACPPLTSYNFYYGGNNDGFDYNTLTQTACPPLTSYNFYLGGNADGQSFTSCGGCGSCAAALPIELLYFNATLQNNKTVLCEWETATEINNDYFTVEASPGSSKGGGMEWETVGIIDGAGNSNSILYYQLIDYFPPLGRDKGWAYYRLKQVDFNGDYSYSDLVAINLEGIDIINLSPNPAEDEIAVLLYSTVKTKVNVNVSDMLGQKVSEVPRSVEVGTTQLLLDISMLSTGYYLVEVITQSGMYQTQKKFVKN